MKIVLWLLFALLFLSACHPQKKIIASGKSVTIGILAPLSGLNQKYGLQSLLGVEFANKREKYLENGDKIVFEVVDTNSTPEGTRVALQSLADKNVTAIISFVGSGNMLASREVLQTMKIPLIVTLATNDEVTALNDFVVQICMSNQREALVAAHFIKDEKFINKVGILYNKTSPYSLSLATQFQKYYKEIHGKELFFLDFSQKNALQILKRKNLFDVKMIFSVLRAKDNVAVLKVLQKTQTDLLLSDGSFSSARENVQDELYLYNGSYIIEHYASDMKVKSVYKKLQKVLIEADRKESSYAFLAYDSYRLLVYALQNCPKYEEECMNALFHNSDIIEGIAGNFSMENGKVKRKIYVDKIDGLRLKKEIVTY